MRSGTVFAYEGVVDIVHFSFNYECAKEGRKTPFSGVFVLQIEDGFFILADVKLYRNVSIAFVHGGSFPCRFSTTLSIKTSPLPAGRYREKRSKRGQGICPCKYKKSVDFAGAKRPVFGPVS